MLIANTPFNYFFLLGRCVSADAAAVFAAFEDLGLLRTLPAADAAFLDVTSLFFCHDLSLFWNAIFRRVISLACSSINN
ncbi:MAG: hypothetical protein ACI8ZB_005511 [Desulforhopalus sp.]